MLLAIGVVTALAYWDEQRENAAAQSDFADEQATIARAVAASVGDRLARASADATGAEPRTDALLSGVRALEVPADVVVLLRRPKSASFESAVGQSYDSKPIADALDSAQPWVRLVRPESAALGLPARMSMAGLSRVTTKDGVWGVAVVASARRERDRERRAELRLALGVGLAVGLVLTFGGLALRKQRKELSLSHDLAIASMRAARDEELIRSDKLATLGALATGIAHEVSTPLGVIVGRAEQLLPRVAADERATRAVTVIGEQADRIDRVIRGFLRLARGDVPVLERAAPKTLATTACNLVEHRFEKAGVKLAQHIDDDLPEVSCEPRLFEQVLVNLLLNACDACSEGGAVELRVDANEEHVSFVVTDDGAGISPEAAKRATEPFFTTKPAGKGTGLGLAIATEIVKHHRGTLDLAARKDARGTVATVRLPRPREDAKTEDAKSGEESHV
jgi:signal transduction histidine kinase